MFNSPRLTEGGYDAENDSDTVRGACNRPVCTHLYALSLQKHEETGLSLCPVASVCADRVRLSDAVPAFSSVTQPFALLPYLSVGLWIGFLI